MNTKPESQRNMRVDGFIFGRIEMFFSQTEILCKSTECFLEYLLKFLRNFGSKTFATLSKFRFTTIVTFPTFWSEGKIYQNVLKRSMVI